ncbi:MAG: HAD family hydrolase [Caldilineaceae bacterium]|nr:HAD family hydrolase [Caldilineaceae bacterium]
MQQTFSDLVVVFDLDDTLYKEIDYVQSGITAVAAMLKSLYHEDLTSVLINARISGVTDIWQLACEKLHLPKETKESLLWFYRLHAPDITLDEKVLATLNYLQDTGATLAILSDGRSVTQRLKLTALGLSHIPAFISEEYSSVKPDPQRFIAISKHWPGRRYVYVGDNPDKDFYAPNALKNWVTIGLRSDGRNIHQQNDIGFHESLPHIWIDDIAELPKAMVQENAQ